MSKAIHLCRVGRCQAIVLDGPLCPAHTYCLSEGVARRLADAASFDAFDQARHDALLMIAAAENQARSYANAPSVTWGRLSFIAGQ